MRRRVLLLTVAIAFTAVVGTATAITPRTTLTTVEKDLMCVVCKTPLAVSQSPEADAERAMVSRLIAKGETKSQIERAMVANYGPQVLGLPPAHGFNLALYVLPPVVLLAGAGLLIVVLPRWRARTRSQAPAPDAAAPRAEDSKRLEEELGRYGR